MVDALNKENVRVGYRPKGERGLPARAKKGEVVGGGFFVFRRGENSNRIRPAMWSFEYPTQEQAEEQAKRLSASHPGHVFEVFGSVSKHLSEAGQ